MPKKTFVSYAQYCEDIIAYEALRQICPNGGVYVDVGANDAIQWSVTRALYERGWHGINIEPLKNKYVGLCEDRKRDINLNIGISNKTGKMDILVANDESTFDVQTQKELLMKGRGNKKVSVKIDTLNNVFDEYIEQLGGIIHFCKIDVEGFEKQVLLSIDFAKVKPWLFCIEMRNTKEWEPILIRNGYRLGLIDTLNAWYVDREYSEKIIPALWSGDALAKRYHIFQIVQYDELKKFRKKSIPEKVMFWAKVGKHVLKKHGVTGSIRLAKERIKDINNVRKV